jgi:hypothetical protein
VGNNDNAAMLNGGAGMAGPIWRNMMSQAIGSSSPSFEQPSGVVKKSVCTEVGTLSDVFLSWNVPKECAKKADKPKKDKPKPQEKCTVEGKETLAADDPNCAVDPCPYDGLEDLASNDPNCIDPATQDDDSDGVSNDLDQCPDTPPGETPDENGCSDSQTPPVTPPHGRGNP